jgi:pimeloyl-ACP methyl ester carboxylesterase
VSSRSRPASSTSTYVDVGPPDGHAVVLLHGWPYDIHTFAEVWPPLAAAGYRVIVPYLRGYGTTRFLADETFRNGQQSVLAVDTAAAYGNERQVAEAVHSSDLDRSEVRGRSAPPAPEREEPADSQGSPEVA